MKYLVLFSFLLCSAVVSSREYLGDDFSNLAHLNKDFRLYKNGDCIEHNFDPSIQYAISGKEGSYYQLVVLENNLPRSMVMGYPTHSSDRVIGKMFHKIDCKFDEKSYTYEIYDDFYDPYRDTSPAFIGYM